MRKIPTKDQIDMPWKIIERKIGRAGGVKRRTARQREWDRQYGEGEWAIGYVIKGEFIEQDEALESVYYHSYEQHFLDHPADLKELISTAKKLRNPHAEATSGVDLQVPAILDFLARNDLELNGTDLVDIGTWDGICSHPIGIRLSPLTIKCALKPKLTLENFWQSKKCLAIYVESPV